ncbi:venom dipeptidyl peptidase 4-like isoform X2 [Ostrinia furnacalis]|uniref:venom dipeptidyl peptidase 4-like isoform X2 n=1 Tax=Ostrinia furnacalis TaxID=93504 RepID=UPI00103AAB9A|nr:venom dipeptidyl peptidase 4-like isoform X2 [Ostrinia furnacalis]
MAQDNSNSTMEMGTSDQVLVASKRKKTLTYVIGGVAMVVVIGVVIALVVVLSGNEGGTAEAIVSTTQGPTTVSTVSTIATETPSTESTPIVNPPTSTTTTTTTTTEAPTTTPEPEEDLLDLPSIINGAFTPAGFSAVWTSGNEALLRNPNGDLVLYDVDSDAFTTLIQNTSALLQQSSRVTLLSPNGDFVALAHSVIPGYRYSFLARYAAVDVVSGNETEILPLVPPPDPTVYPEGFLQNFVWGPSGTSLAYVYVNNIYYQSSLDSEPEPITDTGVLDVVYHGIPDWVYEEEVFISNNAMWFSADGSKLAYATFNDTDVRKMKVPHYGVPGSVQYQYTQHHEIRYPKPGTTNPTVSVTIRDLASDLESTFYAPDNLDEPILKIVQFVSNDTIAVMWTNRVQTSLTVELCPFQGNCSLIYTYTETNGWIDNIPMIFNQQGNAFITILPEAVGGKLFKQVVQISDVNADLWTASGRLNTPHTVAEILRWTPDDVIWYKATHVDDSAEQHIYSVNATGGVSCFTCGITRTDGAACLYNEATLSANGARLAINCAGPEIPQTFIYNSDGERVRVWEENAEVAALLANREVPLTIRPSLPIVDGFPSADVQIQVPHDYLNRTNLPLLVYVYAGPDTALVTKAWNVDWGSSLVSRYGIAVAQIDGRGSGLRGVEDMFAVNRRLGTVEIEDQITVTRYLQQNFNWVDGNRTCIWGWSYGGYAASLALARGGDVFRCAAAVAPVVDWRFYDTIYTERYMDQPQNNPTGYAESSLLTEDVVEAFRDKRYFLIHGTADDNVHFQHAMLISRLLQRRDVYFQQMSYTDEDHGLVGVRPHLYHALEKFLQENMF